MNSEPLLVETSKGFSIKYKNRYLYSKYSPMDGILKLINNIKVSNDTFYILCSPLLCYGFKELTQLFTDSNHYISIEIDKELYKITKHQEDVHFLNSGFDFISLIKKYDFSKFKKCEIIKLNGSVDLYNENYQRLLNIVLSFIHNYWKNKFTLTKMAMLWTKNVFKNLKQIGSDLPIKALKTEKPVVIIGAGESVEDVLQILIDNREHIFILCVDTALQVLIESEILPDAVLALEGQFYNLPDFYKAKNKKIDLIYDLTSYPAVKRTLKGKKYFTMTKFSNSSLVPKLQEAGIVDDLVPPLGSVGISAIYIALKITYNSIFTAGLDFSYKKGKTHSRGTPYNGTILNELNRLNYGNNYKACLNRPLIEKKGKLGHIETSDKILSGYADQAKEIIYGIDRIYDLTQKGLDIGLEYISPTDFKTLVDKKFIYEEINSVSNYNKIAQIFIENEKKNLLAGIDLCKKAIDKKINSDKITANLMDIDYLFEHYPEINPLININEISLKRIYYTLLRYRSILFKY